MSRSPRLIDALKKLIYGATAIPQEFTIGMRQPQQEVSVFLEGPRTSLDVTERHTTACCAPFLLGVGVDANYDIVDTSRARLWLRFVERSGQNRTLGTIRLALRRFIPFGDAQLLLFRVLDSSNYCLSQLRLWTHYVPGAISNWRNLQKFDVQMSYREIRASQVAFIRPHPLMLGSVDGEAGGNMFPMNLLGDLGHGYFAFALKDSRRPAHLVEKMGRMAVSNVPMSLCSIAFQMAANHKRESIDWEQMPFALAASKTFCVPVPASSPRVREMEIEQVHKLGSHTMFIARMVSDEWHSDAPQVHILHGFYQHWRLGSDKARLRSSLIEDSVNKYGAAVR